MSNESMKRGGIPPMLYEICVQTLNEVHAIRVLLENPMRMVDQDGRISTIPNVPTSIAVGSLSAEEREEMRKREASDCDHTATIDGKKQSVLIESTPEDGIGPSLYYCPLCGITTPEAP